MKQSTLNEFVDIFGQTGAAKHLGITQAAVRKALLAGRTITVTEHEDGTFTASEIKPFPSTADIPSIKTAAN